MIWIKENIEKSPSFSPFFSHVDIIEQSLYENPALCVETCKSLIEGICKTILNNKNIRINSSIQFHILVQNTINTILNTDEQFRDDLIELGRRIAAVSQKLGEIRNNVGFSSHGMDVLNPKLTQTVSVFACKIADTIGGFILNCYLNNRTTNFDHRIHYKDCMSFNEYFDELNNINLGEIKISASEALFMQDYEAYKESYFEYLEELEIDNDNSTDITVFENKI